MAGVLLGHHHAGGIMSTSVAFKSLSFDYERLSEGKTLDAEIKQGSLTAIVGRNGG